MSMRALWFETALIGDDWADDVRVEISDGLVSAVRAGVAAEPGDERHAIGLPGLPNLHSHGFQRGMAGLAEARGLAGDDFWSWRDLMYRFLDRLGPDDVEAIAAQAYAEMLESGFTRVGEFHYLHHDVAGGHYAAPAEMASRIAAAAEASGIGLTLLPVFYAHGGFGGAAPGAAQRRFLSDLDSYARLFDGSRAAVSMLPDAVVGVAPHSLRAATPEELGAILPLAGAGPIHIHIAEQQREVTDCLAWSGRRPVEWLLEAAPVDARWCLVHATHMTDAERVALARSGATAGLCPITEANLGDGIFPAAAFLAEGGAFGIGSDSNVRIDAAEELRLLEYGQRLQSEARCVLGRPERPSVGASLFTGAALGGGQALGVAAGIAPGQPADIVSLDPHDPSLVGRRGDQLLDSWIFASRSGIDCVWRRGNKVVEAGKHVRADAIRQRFTATLTRLLAT
jgi:formiminoglutamate deiminase